MGNYKCRRDMLKGWQINAAEMMFRGMSDQEIARELWNTPDDKRLMQNARNRLRTLRNNEVFQEYYRSIITEWSVHNVGKALNKLSSQVDHEKPWVANKAANDILQYSKTLMTGAEDNSVVIKIEGMPELGTPEE